MCIVLLKTPRSAKDDIKYMAIMGCSSMALLDGYTLVTGVQCPRTRTGSLLVSVFHLISVPKG